MTDQVSLSNITVWGGENEDKMKDPVLWTHDYVLYASEGDTLSTLKDPTVLVPYIFGEEDVESKELYDGVYEYKKDDLRVELVEGFDYTIYKIYGESVNFDDITGRLKAAGAVVKKPEIPVDVPGRPPLVDMEDLYRQRFHYRDEVLEKDKHIAKVMSTKSVFRGIIGIIGFAAVVTWFVQQVFVQHYQDVTPSSSDTFIAARGLYVTFEVNNRMRIFKFADRIEDVGYDTTYKMFVPQDTEVRNKIIVSRMTTEDGDVIYELGNRIIDFEPDPADFEFVNARTFEFNTYRNGDASDWSKYGELSRGNAQNIVMQGRVLEQDGKYLFHFGRAYALLGNVSETEPPFYEILDDDISYASILYSLKSKKIINLYGRIGRTFTSRQGRNSVDKIIFSFTVDYARPR